MSAASVPTVLKNRLFRNVPSLQTPSGDLRMAPPGSRPPTTRVGDVGHPDLLGCDSGAGNYTNVSMPFHVCKGSVLDQAVHATLHFCEAVDLTRLVVRHVPPFVGDVA